jgi:uracil DNA glycosylase
MEGSAAEKDDADASTNALEWKRLSIVICLRLFRSLAKFVAKSARRTQSSSGEDTFSALNVTPLDQSQSCNSRSGSLSRPRSGSRALLFSVLPGQVVPPSLRTFKELRAALSRELCNTNPTHGHLMRCKTGVLMTITC